jgi:hypothetical protein
LSGVSYTPLRTRPVWDPVGVGFVGFGLEFPNQFTQPAFSDFHHSFHQSLTGVEHVHHLVVLQNCGGFRERLRAYRLRRFHHAVYRDEHGAVILKMPHLENLISELFPHSVTISGRNRQVFLGDLLDELNEGEHFYLYQPSGSLQPLAFDQRTGPLHERSWTLRHSRPYRAARRVAYHEGYNHARTP